MKSHDELVDELINIIGDTVCIYKDKQPEFDHTDVGEMFVGSWGRTGNTHVLCSACALHMLDSMEQDCFKKRVIFTKIYHEADRFFYVKEENKVMIKWDKLYNA